MEPLSDTSKVSSKKLIITWLSGLFLGLVLSMLTPSQWLTFPSKISSNTEIWTKTFSGLSQYNRSLMINLNICKDHQVFYHLQVTGYDNDSQLEGYLLVSTKDYTKFECKSSNLVNTWVVYHKYRIVFEIYDGNDGILEILYGNSEFISFMMIMKASMFSLMVFFGVLNVLRQKKLDMKDFLERNKYLALVGVWALGFYFPVEAFAVFWNNNTVWIIQSLLVTGFLTVFIGTFKVFNTKNLNFEVFLYFLFTFLLASLNFPYFTSFSYLSLLPLTLLFLLLLKTYKETLTKFLISDFFTKLILIIDLFACISTLLSLQSKLFSLFPFSPMLQTLNLWIIFLHTIQSQYLQLTPSFSIESPFESLSPVIEMNNLINNH